MVLTASILLPGKWTQKAPDLNSLFICIDLICCFKTIGVGVVLKQSFQLIYFYFLFYIFCIA